MGKGNQIIPPRGVIAPTNDKGDVHFGADFTTGLVTVEVRAPLAINKVRADLPMTDIMEIFAQLLQASIAHSRAVAAAIGQQQPPKANEQ